MREQIVGKVAMPNYVTYLNQTPITKWYVVKCGSKKGSQKYMLQKEIGLCDPIMVSILGSILNFIGGRPIGPFDEHENFQFDNG